MKAGGRLLFVGAECDRLLWALIYKTEILWVLVLFPGYCTELLPLHRAALKSPNNWVSANMSMLESKQ